MNVAFLIVPSAIALAYLVLSRKHVKTQEMMGIQYPGERAEGGVGNYVSETDIDEALASGEYETGTSDYGPMLDLVGSARQDMNVGAHLGGERYAQQQTSPVSVSSSSPTKQSFYQQQVQQSGFTGGSIPKYTTGTKIGSGYQIYPTRTR